MISVAIPVGPNPVYRKWLPEAIHSVLVQDFQGPIEIVLIDDFAQITHNEFYDLMKTVDSAAEVHEYLAFSTNRTIKLYKTWWNVGVADSFNAGVALASNELVFMLGSDDQLMPTCLSECHKAWQNSGQKDAWYNVPVQLQDGTITHVNNNACAVTRGLWRLTGGFPPAAGVAACDALLLSILMVHMPDRIIQVESKEPLYWARQHEHQDTLHNMAFYAASGIVEVIRNKETERWTPKG